MKVLCLQIAAAPVVMAAAVAAEGALRVNAPRQLEVSVTIQSLCIRAIYYRWLHYKSLSLRAFFI
jgi:hypothetical protein